jgi:hypothetical protein
MSKHFLSDCGRPCPSHRRRLVEILTKHISANTSGHVNDSNTFKDKVKYNNNIVISLFMILHYSIRQRNTHSLQRALTIKLALPMARPQKCLWQRSHRYCGLAGWLASRTLKSNGKWRTERPVLLHNFRSIYTSYKCGCGPRVGDPWPGGFNSITVAQDRAVAPQNQAVIICTA